MRAKLQCCRAHISMKLNYSTQCALKAWHDHADDNEMYTIQKCMEMYEFYSKLLCIAASRKVRALTGHRSRVSLARAHRGLRYVLLCGDRLVTLLLIDFICLIFFANVIEVLSYY